MEFINFLSKDEVINEVNTIKNGTFFSMTYITDLPVKKEYKAKGYRILKVTEVVTRLGVNYGNIKVIKDRNSEGYVTSEHANNWEWIIKNKIRRNINTGNISLFIAPIKSFQEKVKFIVIDDNSNINTVNTADLNHAMINDSYWSNHENNTSGAVKTIGINHIVRIKNIGRKMF